VIGGAGFEQPKPEYMAGGVSKSRVLDNFIRTSLFP
jgi:hypothetical protein